MNAIDYVKQNGIEKAKNHLEKMNEERWINSFFNDLKQIVDAFDCVMEHGSVEHAKKYAESDYTAPEVKQFLLKAINLVEKCQ